MLRVKLWHWLSLKQNCLQQFNVRNIPYLLCEIRKQWKYKLSWTSNDIRSRQQRCGQYCKKLECKWKGKIYWHKAVFFKTDETKRNHEGRLKTRTNKLRRYLPKILGSNILQNTPNFSMEITNRWRQITSKEVCKNVRNLVLVIAIACESCSVVMPLLPLTLWDPNALKPHIWGLSNVLLLEIYGYLIGRNIFSERKMILLFLFSTSPLNYKCTTTIHRAQQGSSVINSNLQIVWYKPLIILQKCRTIVTKIFVGYVVTLLANGYVGEKI